MLISQLLKKIDFFKEYVEPFITAYDKKTCGVKYEVKHGSVVGGVISVLFFGATAGYLMYLFTVMYSYNKDVTKTAVLTNNFEAGFERVNMNDYMMFYPSMALEPMNTAAGLNLEP